jgi:YhcH/YjgK/YiaL family protein
MADGRYDIDGDDVFALVQSYDTVPLSEKKYESHRVYADIQYIAEGSEIIYYAPTDELVPTMAYDAAWDCILYTDPAAATPLLMEPGRFAIFYARDGHKPGCVHNTASRMKKVVIKVRL